MLFRSYGEAKAALFGFPGLHVRVVNADDAFGTTLLDRPGPGRAVATVIAVVDDLMFSIKISTAAKALLGTKEGVTKLRGKWQTWNNFPLMVTYHPSYLLRPYNQDAKREAWEDLKKVLHFVYD